ncbi:flavodoxin domain-containing protein [Arcticibacter eurypsychrophilus]|uniref:flavodoxin domain-containing protein n=1 Tax=Arcticibacter eurypsychrophilus TaxID=1434752 RepID=UPI00084D278F|nr:flavodoxin domain-containing protein [Arcticibacter eurypsychrophilus]
MKTALIYISRHGTTEIIAQHIAALIGSNVTLYNLENEPDPVITDYDQVIIGGSIHYGSIQDQVKNFCKRNLATLLDKKLGLFICCILDSTDSGQFSRAFPAVLGAHSVAQGVFEGDLVFKKLNFIERILFKPSVDGQDVIKLNEKAIASFIKDLTVSHGFQRSMPTPHIPSKC